MTDCGDEGRLNVPAGMSIQTAIAKALFLANTFQRSIHFEHCGTALTVEPGEAATNILRDWHRDQRKAKCEGTP